MSDNPFEAPKSVVSDVQADAEVGTLLVTPRKMSIDYGWKWIEEGLRLFKLNWGMWIAIFFVYFVLNVVMSILPLLSIIIYIVNPVLMAGLLYGAYEVDQGRSLKMGYLFEGFRTNLGGLFAVGGLYLLGIFIVTAITLGVAFATGIFDQFIQVAMDAIENKEPIVMDPSTIPMTSFLLPILVGLALVLPLAMMTWFAPVLVILHDMGAIEAMKCSFSGCIKNILPFLWYGIISFLLLLVGIIPLGLGLLVVMPILTAALFVSYKDIFLD